MPNKMKAISIELDCKINDPNDMLIPFTRTYYATLDNAKDYFFQIIMLLDSKRIPSLGIAYGKEPKDVEIERLLPIDTILDEIDRSIDSIRGINPSLTRK